MQITQIMTKFSQITMKEMETNFARHTSSMNELMVRVRAMEVSLSHRLLQFHRCFLLARA